MRARLGLGASLGLFLLACGDPVEPDDAGARDAAVDASARDAAVREDAARPEDAAPPEDARPPDDAGLPDCPADLRTFTWRDLSFESQARDVGSNVFVPGAWRYDVHYVEGQIRSDATHAREPGTASIRAFIDPSIAVPDRYAADGYDANFRSEIATLPWHEEVPLGTELWIGFSYYLPPTYVQDTSQRATIFQLHAGRHHPPFEIAHWVPADFSGAHGTRLHVIRRWQGYDTGDLDRVTMPVELEPDHWYDFVVHVVWEEAGGTRGLTEVWVNGMRHYFATGPNTYSAGTDPDEPIDGPHLPYGGTPKLGWYKWPWHDQENVDASAAAGVTELEMFIGAVRILRRPEGDHLGASGYECVAPRGARPR